MILVGGIGNVLLGDDGFGVEVVRRLAQRPSVGVKVVDFGIRGMDLVYALLEPWDAVILVDAARRGREPGTLYVIEPSAGEACSGIEPHRVDPVRVLQTARAMGGQLDHLRVVGCEPLSITGDDEELSMELSAPVAAAVQPAVELVESLVAEARDA
jgi:hydrogenase maturation protease